MENEVVAEVTEDSLLSRMDKMNSLLERLCRGVEDLERTMRPRPIR